MVVVVGLSVPKATTTGQLELKLMSNFSKETAGLLMMMVLLWLSRLTEPNGISRIGELNKKFSFFRVQKEKRGIHY